MWVRCEPRGDRITQHLFRVCRIALLLESHGFSRGRFKIVEVAQSIMDILDLWEMSVGDEQRGGWVRKIKAEIANDPGVQRAAVQRRSTLLAEIEGLRSHGAERDGSEIEDGVLDDDGYVVIRGVAQVNAELDSLARVFAGAPETAETRIIRTGYDDPLSGLEEILSDDND